jgi:hypothetical protein
MIAVIGHGPSLHGSGLGEYIDSFKYVIRFPYLKDWQTPIDYGVRTSYFCATVSRINKRMRKKLPEFGYFLWDKHYGSVPLKWKCKQVRIETVKNVSGLIQEWQEKLPESSPCRFFSHGTAGICIAAAKLGGPITVFGCDNLKIGEDMGEGYVGSWLYEGRTATGQKINSEGAHSLSEERKLIDLMAQEYDVSIEFK